MEANDIMESAKELCSTVNITLDYEAPVHVSRQDSRRSACLVNSVNNSRQLAVPMLLDESGTTFLQREC